jgi:hypothetical protein
MDCTYAKYITFRVSSGRNEVEILMAKHAELNLDNSWLIWLCHVSFSINYHTQEFSAGVICNVLTNFKSVEIKF